MTKEILDEKVTARANGSVVGMSSDLVKQCLKEYKDKNGTILNVRCAATSYTETEFFLTIQDDEVFYDELGKPMTGVSYVKGLATYISVEMSAMAKDVCVEADVTDYGNDGKCYAHYCKYIID